MTADSHRFVEGVFYGQSMQLERFHHVSSSSCKLSNSQFLLPPVLMHLLIKDVENNEFKLSVENSTSIAQVKQQMADNHEVFQNKTIKLYYGGNILSDDQTIESTKLQPDHFFVAVAKKIKKKKKKKSSKKVADVSTTAESSTASDSSSVPATSTTTTTTTSQTTPTPKPMDTTPKSSTDASTPKPMDTTPDSTPAPTEVSETSNPVTTAPPTQSSLEAAANNMISDNEELSNILATLTSLGDFSTELAKAALFKAHGNPDRAAEYLLTGQVSLDDLPDSTAAPPPQNPQQPAVPPTPAGAPAGPSPFASLGAGEDAPTTLEELKNSSQFSIMRALIQEDSQLLVYYLQILQNSSPDLVAEIQSKRDEFLAMVNAPLSPQEKQMAALAKQALQQQMGLPPGQSGAPQPGQPGVISVTPAEKQDIETLIQMGFERSLVIQTYIAVGRNLEAAASVLYDIMEEQGNNPPPQNPPDSGSNPSPDPQPDQDDSNAS